MKSILLSKKKSVILNIHANGRFYWLHLQWCVVFKVAYFRVYGYLIIIYNKHSVIRQVAKKLNLYRQFEKARLFSTLLINYSKTLIAILEKSHNLFLREI